VVRSFEEEMRYIRKVGPCRFEIAKGFVSNMKVPGVFYVNEQLEHLMFEVTARSEQLFVCCSQAQSDD
jgi:tRNA-splicing ligase RtcB